ncbi:MAG: hypothetical protein NVS3B14_04560 [Ktedonobacteraceae bacterium]
MQRMRQQPVSSAAFRDLLASILQLQDTYPNGPAWYEGYSALYKQWVRTLDDTASVTATGPTTA